MADWFNFIKEPVDKLLVGGLGKSIGGALGSQGMGHEIEKWSNPITQIDRNPIVGALKGDYKFGEYNPKWGEQSLNNVNELGALLYGGYTAGAGALSEGGGSTLGGDTLSSTPTAASELNLGGDVTSSTPVSGTSWTDMLNPSRLQSMTGGQSGGQQTQTAQPIIQQSSGDAYYARKKEEAMQELITKLLAASQ
jgi:hypothetical protein